MIGHCNRRLGWLRRARFDHRLDSGLQAKYPRALIDRRDRRRNFRPWWVSSSAFGAGPPNPEFGSQIVQSHDLNGKVAVHALQFDVLRMHGVGVVDNGLLGVAIGWLTLLMDRVVDFTDSGLVGVGAIMCGRILLVALGALPVGMPPEMREQSGNERPEHRQTYAEDGAA